MKILTLILFLLMSVTQAQECERAISEYATDVSSGELSNECLEWVKNQSIKNAKRLSKGSRFKSYASEGALLYYSSNGDKFLTAGPNTQLSQVSAVAFSLGTNRIYALDSVAGRITYYDLEIAGNVAPKGMLSSQEIRGAVDLAVSNDGARIFLLRPDGVVVLDGLRNTLGKKEVKEMRVLGLMELEGASQMQSMALAEGDQEIYFLALGGAVHKMEVAKILSK